MFGNIAMDLRLFDEGGESSGAAAQEAQSSSVNAAPDQQETTTQESVQNPAPAQRKTFDELIKGDYKQDYEKALQNHMARRMKGHDALVQKQKALEPMLGLLALRYGKNADDIDGITKSLESDQKLFEDEAIEKGLTPEQYMQMKRIELENQSLQKQISEYQRQQAAQQQYQQWKDQMAEAKNVFPNINLENELQNDDFVKLLKSGVPIKHAYMVIHQDELLGGAMQFTAQTVAQKVSQNIQARGMRPSENGAGAQSATAKAHKSAKDMTDKEIQQIAEMAKRGIFTPMA